MEGSVGVRLAERARYRLLEARRPRVGGLRATVDVFMVVALLAAGVHLLIWRAGMLRFVGPAGWALFALEAASVVWLVFTAILYSGRTRPDQIAPLADPDTTLDIFIPVAGEPAAMVAATIAAAQAVRWPARIVVCNDGRLAGKDNWREIDELCRRMGVGCLTRTTGIRGKAGNLNQALAGSTADAILVIDADHQVVPDVAQQLLGWLRHDEVAFVATPQQFHDSRRDPLNPTEPVFYRATQPARDRHGLAFSTGNGVVYRREAVVRIGGFSEWSVVEDLHTSIRLHAAGWRSVFHPRPVSIGIAPRTAAEYARQRTRWAVDSLRILRHDPPWRRHGLSRRAKVHYTHTVVSYLMIMVQIGFLLGPPAWIIGRLSLLAGADWRAQLVHNGPWLGMLVLTVARWAGVRGAWRSLRLTLAFLPVVFWVALWRTMRPGSEQGSVTAKTNLPRINAIVVAALMFPLGLLATLVWGAVDWRSGGSDLAMGWAALMAIVSVGPLLRIGHGRFWPALAQGLVVVTAVALTAGSVATARFGWEAPAGLYRSFRVDPATADAVFETNELGDILVVGPAVPSDPSRPLPPAGPSRSPAGGPVDGGPVDGGPVDGGPVDGGPVSRVALAPTEGVYVGFTSDALPYDLGDVDRWSRDVTDPQIIHWYQQWGSGDSRFRGDWLDAVAAQGRVPMISWEAWAKPSDGFALAEQELGNMADIAAGRYDDYIDSWAEAAADHGGPVLLRPFHEMNGFWYPWSVGVNGNTEATYIAGWRHVVDRFRAAGADNVSFVWSINTLASFEAGQGVERAYPGDDYVDWVATSGFNWDDYDPTWSSWVTARWVFAETYELLATFDKPVMFAEIGTGTNGGDEARWVADAMDWFATLDQLHAVVWFDRSYDGSVDFRLGPGQQAAIGRAIDAPDSPFAPDLALVPYPVVDDDVTDALGAVQRRLGSAPFEPEAPTVAADPTGQG